MNFFWTENDYNRWVEKMEISKDEIFCLNIKEALQVSKMLFTASDI